MSLLDDDIKDNNNSITNHICTNDSATIIAHVLDRKYIAVLLDPRRCAARCLPFDVHASAAEAPPFVLSVQKSWKPLR